MDERDTHDDATGALSRRTFTLSVGAGVAVAGAAQAQSPAQAQAVTETDVTVRTPDGLADAALFQPAETGQWPAVVVFADAMGLRPVFRDMGRRLAAQGYVVLVPNPYYRSRKAPVMEPGFDFSNPTDRAKLGELRAALTPDAVVRDGTAYIADLDARASVAKAAKVGLVGYCMGGATTMRVAAALPARVGAIASFHGGGLVTDQPDSPHLLVPRIEAASYFGVADNDDERRPDDKVALKAAFDAARRPAQVEVYDGANHGWCVKGSAAYVEPAAERAWAQLTALYARALV